jgi:glycosyltransferase involved in cell wall biosynthesis
MPRPVRLLLYTDATEVGGAEVGAAALLASLGPHVEATVLGVRDRVVDAIAAGRPGTATKVVRLVRTKPDLGPILEHVRAVRELRPHVFQASLRTTWSCQYGILAAVLRPSTRIVALHHAPLTSTSELQTRLNRLLNRRVHAFVAASSFSAGRVERLLALRPGSVRTIPYGIPDPGPAPGTANRDPVVGAVGRLVREKGFDTLVRALAELPGVRARVAGDGPDRLELERLANELGVADRIELTGWAEDTRAFLATIDVLAAPSRFEAFGIAIAEAMLAERPVVAARVGGIPEVVVEGETALLVPPDDPPALASALRTLLDDPDLRRRMAERGRARVLERFRPAVAANAFEALYDELLR